MSGITNLSAPSNVRATTESWPLISSDLEKEWIRNENNGNLTLIQNIKDSRYFIKICTLKEYRKELMGYKAISHAYPVASLAHHYIDKDHGILIFDHESSIDNNRGLLADFFSNQDGSTNDIEMLITMFRNVFTTFTRIDMGTSANAFYRDRAQARIPTFYPREFLNEVDGKGLILNGEAVSIRLSEILASVQNYFTKNKLLPCILSQADPSDLNLGLKPIVFDYANGGWNPLISELASQFWFCLILSNYLAPTYNPCPYANHSAVFHNLGKVNLQGINLDHTISPARKTFLTQYIEDVIMPAMSCTPEYSNWYEDFRHFLAMRILGIFNVSTMNYMDQYICLAYLEKYFWNTSITSPKDLIKSI